MSKSKAICILGMHRSGTSVIARSINLLGAYIGQKQDMLSHREDNPEGFWEHAGIVAIHEKILKALSSSWDTTIPLPEKWWLFNEIIPFKEELVELVRKNFLEQRIWMWKDPRTSILLPIWDLVFRELDIDVSYVIVVRNPLDVAASLQKRDNFSKEKAIGVWSLYTLSSLFYTRNEKRIVVHYDYFLEDWKKNLENISRSLDLQFPFDSTDLEKNINAFINPNLRHSKTDITSLYKNEELPNILVDIYELCIQAVNFNLNLDTFEFKDKVDKLFSDYCHFIKMVSQSNYNVEFQVFWPSDDEDDVYTEVNSKYVGIEADGETHVYDILLPQGINGSIRIDPANIPSYVEIKSIILLSGDSNILAYWNNQNEFKGLLVGTGVYLINSSESFKILCHSNDPQVYLDVNHIDTELNNLKLRVEISVDVNIPNFIGNLVKYYSLAEKFNLELDDQLRVSEETVEVKNGELYQQEIKLNKLNRDLMDIRKTLSNLEQELMKSKEQVLQQTLELESKMNNIVELNKQIDICKQEIHKFVTSKSWRITAPLRRVMNFLNKRK
jgi:hypothetical protein